MRHCLSSIDENLKTGICSVCGSVRVYFKHKWKGKSQWRCSTKGKDASSRQRQTQERKEYMREYHKKWVISHKDSKHKSDRKSRMKGLYNITQDDFDRMESEQKGLCSICNNPQGYGRKRLCVDHNHFTGKVRGLICVNCNLLLGHARDNVEILERCVAYLRRPQSYLEGIT